MPAMPAERPPAHDGIDIRRSYVTVIVLWLVQLAALFAFQEYFS
jgi:hypothetical protein